MVSARQLLQKPNQSPNQRMTMLLLLEEKMLQLLPQEELPQHQPHHERMKSESWLCETY